MQSDRRENDSERPKGWCAYKAWWVCGTFGWTHHSYCGQCSSFHQDHSAVCQKWLERNSCLIPAEQKARTTLASELSSFRARGCQGFSSACVNTVIVGGEEHKFCTSGLKIKAVSVHSHSSIFRLCNCWNFYLWPNQGTITECSCLVWSEKLTKASLVNYKMRFLKNERNNQCFSASNHFWGRLKPTVVITPPPLDAN